MKRSEPLERKTAIERGEPMRRQWMKRRAPRRVEERKHMRPYVAFVHRLPCVCELGVYRFSGGQTADPSGYRDSLCGGRIEANHAGEKPGMGLKAPDFTCIPMCSKHHRAWTEHRDLFAAWTREERRAWADDAIRQTQLAAVPETRDQALDFEELGLGRIVGDAMSWHWVPLAMAVAA